MFIVLSARKEHLSLELQAIRTSSFLEICNLLGKKIHSENIDSSRMVLNLKLSPGLYFLGIYDESGQLQSKKMIVQ